jgi:hypothetical protein
VVRYTKRETSRVFWKPCYLCERLSFQRGTSSTEAQRPVRTRRWSTAGWAKEAGGRDALARAGGCRVEAHDGIMRVDARTIVVDHRQTGVAHDGAAAVDAILQHVALVEPGLGLEVGNQVDWTNEQPQ